MHLLEMKLQVLKVDAEHLEMLQERYNIWSNLERVVIIIFFEMI